MKRTILSGPMNSRGGGGARRKRLAPKGARLFHSGWLYGLTSISLSLIHRGIIIRPLSLSPLIAYTTCTHTLSLFFNVANRLRPPVIVALPQATPAPFAHFLLCQFEPPKTIFVAQYLKHRTLVKRGGKIYMYYINCIEKTKIKKKRSGWPIFKTIFKDILSLTPQYWFWRQLNAVKGGNKRTRQKVFVLF